MSQRKSSPEGWETSEEEQPIEAGAGRALRADAARNRNHIVAIAREAFASEGLNVSMAEIARRARVGQGTLYRRFASRDELLEEVFAGRVQECLDLVSAGINDPDPWQGFCTVVEKMSLLPSGDRSFSLALSSMLADGSAAYRGWANVERLLDDLVQRAQRADVVRDDVAASDVILAIVANGGLAAAVRTSPDDACRRLTAHLLRAFRAPTADDPDTGPALPTTGPLGLADIEAVTPEPPNADSQEKT